MAESSSSSSFQWKYDVFLSFRGGDTRRNFTDHLYAALHQKGVHAFKDDKELERGKNISLDLLQAIRDSRFSIIIFSKNYADSTWCLDELEIIFECMKQGTLTAISIFYGVDPSDVQELTGEYGNAFVKHANDNPPEKVLKWRVAITEIANVSGLDSQNRHEAEFIKDIVNGLIDQLRNVDSKFRKEGDGLVGMDKHLMHLEMCLRGRSNDVSFLGISGMGGIGKTTIARALYNRISSQFEWRTFLSNVREMKGKHGLVHLQKQLLVDIVHENNLRIWDIHRGMDEIRNRLRHKKVLIILDDVDNLEQLKSLAATGDWFGTGSIVIITTRNERLLSCYGSYQLYKVTELDSENALLLFCLKAFKRQSPKEGYEDLSSGFVEYCKGLSLAIDVMGSFLSGRPIAEWDSTLKRLEEIPNKCILDKLRISFDGLEEIEQEIFLDIACFFKGEDQDRVKRILAGCNFYPEIGLRVLIEKSLISFDSSNRIVIHDLLQEMGRKIIIAKSPKEPGKRSRLWLFEDVYHILSNNTEAENVEAIKIEEPYNEEGKWSTLEVSSTDAFLKMKRLRLLWLPSLNISCELVGLPNTLSYLNWNKYPFKSLPDAFHPNQLVELHMPNSKVKQLWKGTKSLKMLRIIDLSYSEELTLSPDFVEMPNLEILHLEGCIKLPKVYKSIGLLKKLKSLNLKNCKSLTILPSSICDVESLKILNLNSCSSLEALPGNIGDLKMLVSLDLGDCRNLTTLPNSICDMESLKTLNLNGCSSLMALPGKIGELRKLEFLNLGKCKSLTTIPSSICEVKSFTESLKTLNLNGCSSLQTLPGNIGELKKLVSLNLEDCRNFTALPGSICYAESLKTLNLNGCSSLETLPGNIGDLKKLVSLDLRYCKLTFLPGSLCGLESFKTLNLNGCSSLQTLPGNIGELKKLVSLDLGDCRNFTALPGSICDVKSLKVLNLTGCLSLETLPGNIGDLKKLVSLDLRYCKLTFLPGSLCGLESLKTLNLNGCSSLQTLPGNIGELKKFVSLNLEDCRNLTSLPGSICCVESLKTLNLNGCSSLETLPGNIGDLKKLVSLDLRCCKLTFLPGSLCGLESLKTLNLNGCSSLRTLPGNIGELKKLVCLNLKDCRNFTALPGSICDAESLETLNLNGCSSLVTLPGNIGDLKKLVSLDLRYCKLTFLPGSLCGLESLRTLNLNGCSSLQTLPGNIGELKKLVSLDLGDCRNFTTLPSSICGVKLLKTLNLNGFESLAKP